MASWIVSKSACPCASTVHVCCWAHAGLKLENEATVLAKIKVKIVNNVRFLKIFSPSYDLLSEIFSFDD
jgi:hypothetical protein